MLHLAEVVVVERHVGHDGLLVGVADQHVLHVQQLHDAKLSLRQREGVAQGGLGLVAAETAIVKEVRPGVQSDRQGGMEQDGSILIN